MAAPDHNLSRRGLLGAALAVPCAASFDTRSRQARSLLRMSGDGESAWGRALAAVGRAEAGVRDIEARSARVGRAEQFALEEAYGDRLDDLYAAMRRLMLVPAPNVAALAAKIVLAVDHDFFELAGGRDYMQALKRDAVLLAGQA